MSNWTNLISEFVLGEMVGADKMVSIRQSCGVAGMVFVLLLLLPLLPDIVPAL